MGVYEEPLACFYTYGIRLMKQDVFFRNRQRLSFVLIEQKNISPKLPRKMPLSLVYKEVAELCQYQSIY